MRVAILIVLTVAMALASTGCASWTVSRPYVGTMTRVDQNIEKGNQGYLLGTPPALGERKLTRQLITVDIDVPTTASEAPIDTFAGKPGITKTAEPGDVVHPNQAPGYGSAARPVEDKVVEVKREVTVVREETPTAIKQTTIVREEEIK